MTLHLTKSLGLCNDNMIQAFGVVLTSYLNLKITFFFIKTKARWNMISTICRYFCQVHGHLNTNVGQSSNPVWHILRYYAHYMTPMLYSLVLICPDLFKWEEKCKFFSSSFSRRTVLQQWNSLWRTHSVRVTIQWCRCIVAEQTRRIPTRDKTNTLIAWRKPHGRNVFLFKNM